MYTNQELIEEFKLNYPEHKDDNIFIQFHVFSYGIDDYFDTYQEAKTGYDELAQEHDSARVYVEFYDDEEFLHEDCLNSKGEYPW